VLEDRCVSGGQFQSRIRHPVMPRIIYTRLIAALSNFIQTPSFLAVNTLGHRYQTNTGDPGPGVINIVFLVPSLSDSGALKRIHVMQLSNWKSPL
jgi:hypothetical protein